MATLSVIHPIATAFGHTRRILFEPFRLSKWLRLGFCAFLLGSLQPFSFGGGSSTNDSGFSSGEGADRFEAAIAWIQNHLPLVLSVGVALLLLLVGLGLLVTWLSSRGHFMLLDGVMHNRGAIEAPWREFRREANSLFRFRFLFGGGSLLVLLLLLGMLVLIGTPLIRSASSTPGLVVLGLVAVLLLVVWIVVVGGISLLLADFVVPVMALRRIPVLPAWRLVVTNLVKPHPGSIALYVLARLLLNSVLTTLAGVVTILSCCLALVPYIGSVILLPLMVFQISYPLAFLEQLGPQYRFFPPEPPAAA